MRTPVLLSLLTLLSPVLSGEELKTSQDSSLSVLLNQIEILAEKHCAPFSVRLLRVVQDGECDGTPQSCPKADLFVAVSTCDEAPDRQLYLVPRAAGWEFIRGREIPSVESRDSYMTIELRREDVSEKLERGWFTYRTCELNVNPWRGNLRELQERSPTP